MEKQRRCLHPPLASGGSTGRPGVLRFIGSQRVRHDWATDLIWSSLRFQGSSQTHRWDCFLVFGNFSLFQDSLPGTELHPYLFLSFIFFSYLLLKTMGCFSGCVMSSARIQKLFCGIYSAFKCSFDEFVGQKVISLSYSSTILGPPLGKFYTLFSKF